MKLSLMTRLTLASFFLAGMVTLAYAADGSNYVNVYSCRDVEKGIMITREMGQTEGFLSNGIRDAGHGLRDYLMKCVAKDRYYVEWKEVSATSTTSTTTSTPSTTSPTTTAPACPGPYHVLTPAPDNRCVWSCSVGTTPDAATNECVCKVGYTQTSTDSFKRRVCEQKITAEPTPTVQPTQPSQPTAVQPTVQEKRMPDFVVKDILQAPNQAVANYGTDVLTIRVANIGSADAPQDNLSIYIWIDDQLEWTYNSSTLARKAFLNVGGVSDIQPQILRGKHKVKSCVDYTSYFAEFNESNNCMEVTLIGPEATSPTPTPTPTPTSGGLPDVVVNIDKIDRTSIVYAAKPATWITYTVTNKGTASTGSKIYLRPITNGSFDQQGYMTVDSLDAGASFTNKFAVGHDSLWPTGYYEVKLEADYQKAIAESNENNNFSNGVDFTVTASSITPTPTPAPLPQPSPELCKTGVNNWELEEGCEDGYRYARFECYDGHSGKLGGPTSCKPSKLWSQYVDDECQGRSNSKCPTPSTDQFPTYSFSVTLTSTPRSTNGSAHENGYLATKMGDRIRFNRLIEQKGIVNNAWNWHWDSNVLDCKPTPDFDSPDLSCKVIAETGGSVVYITMFPVIESGKQLEVESNMIKVYTEAKVTTPAYPVPAYPTQPPRGFQPFSTPLPTLDTGLSDAGYEDEVITATGAKNPFSDTDLNTLVGQAAANLHALGIIGGYPDGTFKGDRKVNRAEAAKFLLLSRYSNSALQEVKNEGKFWDVLDGQWYTRFILNAYIKGVMGGYPDGSMGPGKNVNTAEFLKMLSLNFALPLDLAYSYKDVPGNAWFAPYAGIAEEYNLFPDRKTRLSPGTELSRAEVAIALYQYLSKR